MSDNLDTTLRIVAVQSGENLMVRENIALLNLDTLRAEFALYGIEVLS